MKKFTFKTNKPTGRYKSFFSDHHDIKFNKKKVGNIIDQSFKIRLMVIKDDINEDGNPNCEWKWIQLAKQNNSLQEAKEWLNKPSIIEKIFEKYKLKLQDD